MTGQTVTLDESNSPTLELDGVLLREDRVASCYRDPCGEAYDGDACTTDDSPLSRYNAVKFERPFPG